MNNLMKSVLEDMKNPKICKSLFESDKEFRDRDFEAI